MRHRIYLVTLLFLFSQNIFSKEKEEERDFMKFGGAVRFNTIIKNFEESEKTLDASAQFDVFMLTADAHKFGFDMSLQYRFYP